MRHGSTIHVPRRGLGRSWLYGLACALTLLSAPAMPQGAPSEPLVMPGKTRLYERVLMRRTVARLDSPGGIQIGETAQAVDPFYVYARIEEAADPWLQLGPGTDGSDLFWVRGANTVPWLQNIVLTFTQRGDPERALIMETLDDLYDVVESETPARDATSLLRAAEAREAALRAGGSGPPAPGVVALGPRAGIDRHEQFYVMPILQVEDTILGNHGWVKLLEVAVAKNRASETKPQPVQPGPVVEDYRAGVVFVVDTTRSMGPYIERTRAAVARVVERIAESKLSDRISFGLVGFRDSLEGRPDVDYVARSYVDLADDAGGRAVVAALLDMKEAQASTHSFIEDSFAGVKWATDQLSWGGLDKRFIVLITDAGPRLGGDARSATGLQPSTLAHHIAESADAVLIVFHLKTEEGRDDHATAEMAYRQLATQHNIGPLYLAVQDGDELAFQRVAELTADVIVGQLDAELRGFADPEPPTDLDATTRAFVGRILEAGRAMRLDYLGEKTGERAPDLFLGWLADRDLVRPSVQPVEIRLLLTKRQLSDLEQALGLIIERGEANQVNPEDFFRSLLAASADMARRPEAVAEGAVTLAEAVAVSEYLEGLPYASHIMTMTEDDWVRLSASEQQEILDLLYSKRRRYKTIHDTPAHWTELHSGDAPADHVYRMLLDELP